MDFSVFVRRPVATSVLIVTACMIAIGTLWGAAVLAFNIDPPNSAGTVTTIISIFAGASWFRRRIGRPMFRRERLAFATGVTLVNAVIPLVFAAVVVLWAGLPLTPSSVDLVFGGGQGFLLEPAFAWLMVFILAVVFAAAYFAGGRRIRTRNTPETADQS